MKWIEEIINVEDYKIQVLWNDKVLRTIDLTDFLNSKTKNSNSSYTPLLENSIFQSVKCDGTTLYWENLIEYKDIDGSIHKGNLDISPELLYEIAVSNIKIAI